MKERILFCLAVCVLALCLAGAVQAAEVSQGKCITYDKEHKLITIEEYDLNFSKEFPYGHPTGVTSIFNVGSAEIGALPEPGDILRLAFNAQGQEKMATKVMNVSKLDLKKN